VSLVERMLEPHQRLASARASGEREMCQRQIEATDRQVDALVASRERYGLTEEEIKIVEGQTW
jgi:hypothetical protein